MNWYKRHKNLLMSAVIYLEASSAKKEMVKIAYTTKDHNIAFARQDYNDGYQAKIQLTQNKNKIILTARFISDVQAMPLYTEMWAYGEEEHARAVKTFNRVVNVVEDMKVDFEDAEVPGPTLQGKTREQLRYIDIERKRQTNNRSLEAAKYMDGGVTDWRESLYGNRYPIININNQGVVNFSDMHGKQS